MEPKRPTKASEGETDSITERVIDVLIDAKDARKSPAIQLEEDPEVLLSIKEFLKGTHAETKAALRARRHRAWKGYIFPEGWDVVKDELRDIRLRITAGRERACRMRTPAALRQMSMSYVLPVSEGDIIPTVQLVPNRRHASSGYPYPLWLIDYGVTREDWLLFISRIRQANRIRPGQYAVVIGVGFLCEVFALIGWPFRILAFGSLATIQLYFSCKRRNLEQAVLDGEIPTWTAAWNLTYFGPKGLSVGFDLPGPVFPDTFVHPKPKFFAWSRILHSPLRPPMRYTRAARRARITVARVQNPVADAGRVPHIRTDHMPKVQEGKSSGYMDCVLKLTCTSCSQYSSCSYQIDQTLRGPSSQTNGSYRGIGSEDGGTQTAPYRNGPQ